MTPARLLLLSKNTRLPSFIRSQFANAEKGVVIIPSLTRYHFQDAAMSVPAVVGMPVLKSVCPATGVVTTWVNVTLQQDAGGLKYLAANGVNSAGVTTAIDFTGTGTLTLSAGVRKTSDAAVGIVSELSADSATNAGSFYFAAPVAAGDYRFAAKGNLLNARAYTTYTAPISNVLTATLRSTAADSNASQDVRINGADVAGSLVTDANSTGNFGNHALHLFMRGGLTLPLNGRLYGYILRGAASTAGEIVTNEAYLSRLTGA
jgi:hypothetical protein